MIKSAVEDFDLFSKPFVFFVGNKKSKSTFFGGILSLAVLAVSGAYFYYLLHMYFSNQVEPKITLSNVMEASYTSLKIQDSFFIFQYFIGGVPLTLYQEQVSKTFLTFSVNYEMFHSDGTIERIPIPLIYCTDELFQGYICLDPSEVINKNIFMDVTQSISSDFSLEINYCDPTIYNNCASPTELYDTIFRRQNVFSINIQIRQYSATKREYQSGYKQEYYYFDPNNVIFTRFSLIKASTTVIEGMVIQSSELNDTIYDFKRFDTVFSNKDIQTRLDFSGIALLAFENNQVKNIITVQHAMITETLAQFMGIFNSLLTVGILCRMLAETHIVEDMNSILLKEYYKKTALRLVSRHDNKSGQDKRTSSSIKNTQKKESETIGLLQKRIKEIDFSKQSRKYFDLSCMNRCRMFFSKLLGKHSTVEKKNKKSQENDNGDAVIYQHLLNQSVKRINIFEVYKDLIKLKMAIKLILTKEQYAAIQFCGSELAIDEKGHQKEQAESNNNNNNNNNNNDNEIENDNPGKDVKQQYQTIQDKEFPATVGICQITPKNFLGQEKDEEGISCINFPLSPLKNYNSTQDNMQSPIQNEEPQKTTEEKNQQNNCLGPLLKPEDSRKDVSNEENIEIQISSSRNPIQKQSIFELRQSEFPVKEKIIKTFQNKMQIIHGDQNESDLISFHDSEESSAKTDENTKKISKQVDIKSLLKIAKSKQLLDEKNQGNNNNGVSNKSYFDNNIKSVGSFWNTNRSHLYEMNLIEEDSELQEKLLQTFLDRVKSGKEGRIKDHVDRQIFASLIKYEKQANLLDCYDQMEKKIQGSVPMKNQQEKNNK